MNFLKEEADIVVIGAGHAGIEAAVISAKLGKKTFLLTLSLDKIANMPCNPSIGGTAKGHLVRELDVLGGVMGKVADLTTIQSKILNRKRGPAVRSLRAQIDRINYHINIKNILESQKNLFLKQDEVVEIEIKNNRVVAILTKLQRYIKTKAVIIACGTYLKSKTFVGEVTSENGPDLTPNSVELSNSLKKFVNLRRFKTGTPARVNRKSIDFSKLEVEKGDEITHSFSFFKTVDIKNKINCFKAYTNEKTHEVILNSLKRSPLYSGIIKGVGPRYCPSIEDKIVRFKDKQRHAVFVEPMGLKTDELYLQGLSSSLPLDIQIKFLKTIKGFENIEVMRPAYAIEYDCINPTDLFATLEFKNIQGLYGAGQFNGTSGYEEAAVQGFVAGVNAVRKINNQNEFILNRASCYIGVLIDDLITKGCTEPYRIMTARSEYRLYLRHDNVDVRLCDIANEIETITKVEYYRFKENQKNIEDVKKKLKTVVLKPTKELNEALIDSNTSKITNSKRLDELIKRPQLNLNFFKNFINEDIKEDLNSLSEEYLEKIEIEFKYLEFIKKQQNKMKDLKKLEKLKLFKEIDYEKISSLRKEAREKLNKVKPLNLAQASRISGVNPADIIVLTIWLKSNNYFKNQI